MSNLRLACQPVPESPRVNESLLSFMPTTPTGDSMKRYKYSCPICINLFRSGYKSTCRGHYLCYNCCITYIRTKSVRYIDDLYDKRHVLYGRIDCPNCTLVGFRPEVVKVTEEVRDYSMKHTNDNSFYISPVKIGDSFEDLKRKMVSYDSPKNEIHNPVLMFTRQNTEHTYGLGEEVVEDTLSIYEGDSPSCITEKEVIASHDINESTINQSNILFDEFEAVEMLEVSTRMASELIENVISTCISNMAHSDPHVNLSGIS